MLLSVHPEECSVLCSTGILLHWQCSAWWPQWHMWLEHVTDELQLTSSQCRSLAAPGVAEDILWSWPACCCDPWDLCEDKSLLFLQWTVSPIITCKSFFRCIPCYVVWHLKLFLTSPDKGWFPWSFSSNNQNIWSIIANILLHDSPVATKSNLVGFTDNWVSLFGLSRSHYLSFFVIHSICSSKIRPKQSKVLDS